MKHELNHGVVLERRQADDLRRSRVQNPESWMGKHVFHGCSLSVDYFDITDSALKHATAFHGHPAVLYDLNAMP